jgi:tRNA A37 threonylcarbamoyladenosine modification protein TsaB
VRIGLATAWGLGRAAGIPVEAVSTLACMAEAARGAEEPRRVAAVLDAGRGELVLERYAIGEDRARPLAPAARVAVAAVSEAAQGDAIVELPAGLTGAPAIPLPRSPAAALALAVSRAPGPWGTPLRAEYARPSAAEAAREAATARKGVEKRGAS